MRNNLLKDFFIITCITLALFLLLEAGVRLYISYTRGSSTAGIPERTIYLKYQPYVMFGKDWNKAFASIGEKKEGHCRILLLGGSTAEAFPENILKEAFQDRFPEIQFDIINAAGGGYNARQELIILSLWGTTLDPDIIITLDGANDIIHRLRMKEPGAFYLNSTYELFIKRPLLAPLAHLSIQSQLIQGILRFRERGTIKTSADYVDAVPVYLNAQHSINLLTRGLAATRIMVLQPFMAFKQPLSSSEKNFTHYKYREQVMSDLYEHLNQSLETLAKKDHVVYIDARDIYNGILGTIFTDDVHLADDKGYRILAEKIASAISIENFHGAKGSNRNSFFE